MMTEEKRSAERHQSGLSLRLSGPFALTNLRFLETEEGPNPRFALFGVDVVIEHGLNGRLIYEADDLYFSCDSFRHFSMALQLLQIRQCTVASLESVGRTFEMRVSSAGNYFQEEIRICEFTGIAESDAVMHAKLTIGDNNVLQEWSENVDIFAKDLQVCIANESNKG